jgi:acetolactate synthase-1/2/3 large subunit
VVAAAKALKQPNSMLFIGGRSLRARGLELAGKIAAKTGCKVQGAGGTARIERGAGRIPLLRLHFVVETALEQLKGTKQMVLCGAKAPYAFFAYPGKPSVLSPDDCEISTLCPVEGDPIAALEALAMELDAMNEKPKGVAQPSRPERPTGKFTLDGLGQALGATMPEGAIVVDESVTTGRGFFPFSAGAPPHDWLNNMGGSIGFGAPVAVGAAVACPDRKVICMIGDGSSMYTIQALWTMTRENLDVCVMIFSNRNYKILYSQLADVGAANPGPRAIDMLTIDRPTLQFTDLAKGMGVASAKAHDLDELTKQLTYAMSTKGPYLIDVVM